ncbi:MAG: response regulator [Methylomonas sp.]|nr:response regulator [Methylomonas sp.]PPD19560.1 MAG: hybrid sensor histidine kinase/response regulator [Methylomonas sp.]PPD25075.1 MAG: hybrid sensor histidine kinase/response regulator [Methylomonas sp.]PPD34431.1 MAG: hybrid sensor histidine kinase/response regulator [Methylomonas sp.]PPD38748.1 MAG: hybrid sensor histidine kinase/response regulator [Methylomonas sp.]
MTLIRQSITKVRRDYNTLVANETLEDYALRYAPRSFRKWSEFQVANTALGSTSFLVLEAIGGFLSINYGFTNAVWAILAAGIVIFITSLPISYYAAHFHIDIDLLTRAAGFGYIGSTVTSLIYASFTFTLFALEASIMSLALELFFQIPLAYAHIISAVIVIPLAAFGITTISRMQMWTQPVWLVLLIAPYVAVANAESEALMTLESYAWIAANGQSFDWLLFGSAMTIACSMVAQIGEQVDFLRFLPDKTDENKWRWWGAMLTAGPGWVVFGVVRQLLGALLAHLAIRHGIAPQHAHEPTQMYLVAYNELFDDPRWALAATTLFVVLSQLKINVTNAYAGSLAWSNFFSRLTHSHPGRVVWLLFNVLIALLLMEFGVFGALEKVLGLFSNMSIAWISTVAADLMINKPLGLSPKEIEFKRAYLPDLNPVGMIAAFTASVVSILAYVGLFGEWLQAFSALIALTLAFVLTPTLAWWSKGQHYLARDRDERNRYARNTCSICENEFEHEDVAYCPAYGGSICSLCCTLDARCLDSCKPGFRFDDYLERLAKRILPDSLSLHARLRLLRFGLLFLFLSTLTGLFIGIIYYQDLLSIRQDGLAFELLLNNFLKIYASLLVFIGLCTWWLILNAESRRVAYEESARQTQLLLQEIEDHQKTDLKLQQAQRMADTANQAKSRFLSNMSHEIRSPLNSIIGYAHILNQDPSIPPHRRQAVETLKRSGEHLCSLIEDVLDITRIKARKFDFKYQPIQFPDFIGHLVHIYRAQAEDKGLSFTCQITTALPQRVRGDEKRVGQILMNLLGNAIKFTSTGSIVFRISYASGVASFQVIDTGSGIDEEQIQNIFQPFTRLDNPTGNAMIGSGLGLTISKILAELMGGELMVQSVGGEGSTFSLRLLLPSLRPENEHEPQAEIIGYCGRRRKILLADDQVDHRHLLLALLEPLGFHLIETDSGEQCLEKTTGERPDLILLDIAMNGIDGIETALRLREAKFDMPIIVISANAYPGDRMAAINAGCDDFLSKPFKVDELLHKLGLHLNLDWQYRNNALVPTPAPVVKTETPQITFLRECAVYARIGDLLGLKKLLADYAEQQPRYAGFCTKLIQLANQFRIGEIKVLLNMNGKQDDTP